MGNTPPPSRRPLPMALPSAHVASCTLSSLPAKLHRRIVNLAARPGHTNQHIFLHVPSISHHALHPYNKHSGHLYTRGVQGI
ncbi:hypothetical protein J1614_003450 [Plenodomus biglobosus]|nr:hypothetical protein J1614_003450 [Plenodomus biglobosus]